MYVNQTRYDPNPNGNLCFCASIEKKGNTIIFSDEEHRYALIKWWRLLRWDEEPIMNNVDWGNIFRIRAIVNNKAFRRDGKRSENTPLYYLDGVKNDIAELIGFDGEYIYWWASGYGVYISKYNCYTGLTTWSKDLWIFDMWSSACVFI